jgi:hypothetical protein
MPKEKGMISIVTTSPSLDVQKLLQGGYCQRSRTLAGFMFSQFSLWILLVLFIHHNILSTWSIVAFTEKANRFCLINLSLNKTRLFHQILLQRFDANSTDSHNISLPHKFASAHAYRRRSSGFEMIQGKRKKHQCTRRFQSQNCYKCIFYS